MQNYSTDGKNYIIQDPAFDPFIGLVDDPSTFPPLPGPFMTGEFEDYVRFMPRNSTDSIWVALGIVRWHINGSALVPYGLIDNDMPFASEPDNSDEFPKWPNNVSD